MILTVTLNAALDRTIAVPRFAPGRRHRAIESRTVAGGKGINVARALKLLGHPVIATGFIGGSTGERIRNELTAEGVLHDFTRIEAESRTNISVADPTSSEQTEINERGAGVSAAEMERFSERLLYLAEGARYCVIAGSLPPGLEPDTYRSLIGELRRLGVKVLLDTDGEPMRLGLRAGPEVVAPNSTEAEQVVGYEFGEAAELLSGAALLVEMGAREALITRPDGCVGIAGPIGGRRAYEVSIEMLDPISKTGSGDAFVAGYLGARYRDRDVEECLAYGVAAGAESTQHIGAGVVDRAATERLLDLVVVRSFEEQPVGG